MDISITDALQTAIQTMSALLASKAQLLETEILAQISGTPKPSYSIGNRSVSWNEWRSELQNEITALTKDIENAALLISKLQSFDLTQQAVVRGNAMWGY
jgi:hypothetical protein